MRSLEAHARREKLGKAMVRVTELAPVSSMCKFMSMLVEDLDDKRCMSLAQHPHAHPHSQTCIGISTTTTTTTIAAAMTALRLVLLVALLLLSSMAVQPTDARALRRDTLHYDSRLAAAEQVALRERYHAIRYRGAVDDDASVATALAHEREALAAADTSLISNFMREVTAIVTRIAQAVAGASTTSSSDTIHAQDTVTAPTTFTAITSATVPLTAPLDVPPITVSTRRGVPRRGQLCIARMCGLHLFFASVGVTFVACFVVVYVLDQQLHRQSEALDDRSDRKKTAEATMTTETMPTPTKRTTTKYTSSGLRARISRYYRDVAELSSSVLRPRPPLGI